MASTTITKKLRIGGMTCVNCQNRIAKQLDKMAGIVKASVSYNEGTAVVTYDTGVVSLAQITAAINKLDYQVLDGNGPAAHGRAGRGIGALVVVFALYTLMERFGFTQLFSNFRLAEAGMGYGMLFVIGLVTSVHCVAMCGGINMSQCIPAQAAGAGSGGPGALRPSFLYNLGRVVSYTAVGGIVGAIGGVVAPSGMFRGAVQIAAGVFMVIMGINMLGIFPSLRRLVPRMPRMFTRVIDGSQGKGPLYVGLLNGLMPCGPLQAMQLYALSTGNPIQGAISMLVFSLGTVPLMFGLGAASSLLSRKFAGRMMAVGAVLVTVLGLSMFTQGMSLSGFSGPPLALAQGSGDEGTSVRPGPGAGGAVRQGAGAGSTAGQVPNAGSTIGQVPGAGNTAGQGSNAAAGQAEPMIEDGVQVVNSALSSRRYPEITVKAGVPVRWVIDAPDGSINGCNNRMLINEYGIEHSFKPGENIIEFTPSKTGTFQYTCWMGMIRSTITVVE